ncbi:MAG TPA: hypothetical protein VIE46_08950 [Gemmatimonadales bacterium]
MPLPVPLHSVVIRQVAGFAAKGHLTCDRTLDRLVCASGGHP